MSPTCCQVSWGTPGPACQTLSPPSSSAPTPLWVSAQDPKGLAARSGADSTEPLRDTGPREKTGSCARLSPGRRTTAQSSGTTTSRPPPPALCSPHRGPTLPGTGEDPGQDSTHPLCAPRPLTHCPVRPLSHWKRGPLPPPPVPWYRDSSSYPLPISLGPTGSSQHFLSRSDCSQSRGPGRSQQMRQPAPAPSLGGRRA